MKKILGLFICVSMVCLTLYVPKVEAKTLGDLKKELNTKKINNNKHKMSKKRKMLKTKYIKPKEILLILVKR